MKTFAIFFVILFINPILCENDVQINPTGTYKLKSKTIKKGNDVFGYTGEAEVIQINPNRIIMAFWICKGAPSYNSGSFIDTLTYNDNTAIYTDPDTDSTCVITFQFTKMGLAIKEETADYNFGCGFGHAVVADGLFYKKISSKPPVIKESELFNNL